MQIYKNVMEILVEEEIKRRFLCLSPRLALYINKTEVLAYALNQLPALYATSERGLEKQLEKARSQFSTQISQAVRQAYAAVQRDPIRNQTPINPPLNPFLLKQASVH